MCVLLRSRVWPAACGIVQIFTLGKDRVYPVLVWYTLCKCVLSFPDGMFISSDLIYCISVVLLMFCSLLVASLCNKDAVV